MHLDKLNDGLSKMKPIMSIKIHIKVHNISTFRRKMEINCLKYCPSHNEILICGHM